MHIMYAFQVPEGFSSKNFEGALDKLVNMLLCMLTLIFMQYSKKPMALNKLKKTTAATNPVNTQIYTFRPKYPSSPLSSFSLCRASALVLDKKRLIIFSLTHRCGDGTRLIKREFIPKRQPIVGSTEGQLAQNEKGRYNNERHWRIRSLQIFPIYS